MIEVMVTVSGPKGSGKSAIAQTLQRALMGRGFTVTLDDLDEERSLHKLDQAVKGLVGKSTIRIKTDALSTQGKTP